MLSTAVHYVEWINVHSDGSLTWLKFTKNMQEPGVLSSSVVVAMTFCFSTFMIEGLIIFKENFFKN